MAIEYTDWFPPEIKPVRNGLYLLKFGRNADCWHMGYWHDDRWYSAGVEGCPQRRTQNYRLGSIESMYWWRGLTRNNPQSKGKRK